MFTALLLSTAPFAWGFIAVLPAWKCALTRTDLDGPPLDDSLMPMPLPRHFLNLGGFAQACHSVLLLLAAVAVCSAREPAEVSAPLVFTGAVDGSAAVAIDATFFLAASDEDSVLRIYRRDQAGAPVQSIDLTAFLGLTARSPEADVEAAARIGSRAFWMSSHGRNPQGREKLGNYRFFATDISTNGGTVVVTPVGKPYKDLLRDLMEARELDALHLAEAASHPPKVAGALSIEGLCATPNKQLLIGFRNPVPQGRALLVPMLNPEEVIQGSRARFGAPVLLDLGGLGIRDMAYCAGRYLIIAGPFDGKGQSRLYEWKGGDATPKLLKDVKLKGLNPEAIILYPDKTCDEFQLLSDDSKEAKEGLFGKSGSALFGKEFRGVWIKR